MTNRDQIAHPKEIITNRGVDKDDKVKYFIEYYTFAFLKLHQEIDHNRIDSAIIEKRNNFWKYLDVKEYKDYKALELLESYRSSIVRDLECIISKEGLDYWFHIYRRLSPGAISDDVRMLTILRTRAFLELSFLKFSNAKSFKVGLSKDLDDKQILNGFLVDDNYTNILSMLKERNQLVLTKFGVNELEEFYIAESFAAELARISASIRTIYKGGIFFITNHPRNYHIFINDNVSFLTKSYDKRVESGVDSGTYFFSSIGVVSPQLVENNKFLILLPLINVDQTVDDVSLQLYKDFHDMEMRYLKPGYCNFCLVPFDLVSYYQSHKNLGEYFFEHTRIRFSVVIGTIFLLMKFVLGTILNSIDHLSQITKRGYFLINDKDAFYDDLMTLSPDLVGFWGEDLGYSKDDLLQGVDYLSCSTQKKSVIDFKYPGPFSIFHSIRNDSLMIDVSHVHAILNDMFYGVKLSNQDYKGKLLEEFLYTHHKFLCCGEFVASDSSKEEIDAIFELNVDIVVVVECKAISMSIGFDIGDYASVSFRNDKMNKALRQVERKCRWLSNHKVSNRYDFSRYKYVISVIISPFVEYIGSTSDKYWLNKSTPRFLTPNEFFHYLDSGQSAEKIHRNQLIRFSDKSN